MGKGLCIQSLPWKFRSGQTPECQKTNYKSHLPRNIATNVKKPGSVIFSPVILRDFSIEISSNIKRYKENFIFHLHGLYILSFFNINLYKYLFHISDIFNFNINSSDRGLSFKRTNEETSTLNVTSQELHKNEIFFFFFLYQSNLDILNIDKKKKEDGK